MKIELNHIKIKDIFESYKNNDEEGVLGYGGILNIRPKYQREFVYKDKQRDSVIHSITSNFPLNVMYWAKSPDGTFEVMDGQQRTISICSYLAGDFSINFRYFHNLAKEEQDQILNYELMVYVCEGTIKEKLDWFKIINIAGEKLTEQELRNAVYTGEWLTDAKRHFSKSNSPAYSIGSDYVSGKAIRQEYLETALKWIADKNGTIIDDYMALHQLDKDASELWIYYERVIQWVRSIFTTYRSEMKGIDWGIYYNKHKDIILNPNDVEVLVKKYMMDDDVTNKKGIYEHILDKKEKHLNIRAFTLNMKREAFERQGGKCVKCSELFKIEKMEGDHITPWSRDGKTNAENCQMLCVDCNRTKSDE